MRNLPVRFKISAVAFTPMLAALVLAVVLGIDAQQRAAAATHSRARTELAVSAAELVHQVQRERAYTSGFLSSGGESFVGERDEQMLLTSAALEHFESLATEVVTARA